MDIKITWNNNDTSLFKEVTKILWDSENLYSPFKADFSENRPMYFFFEPNKAYIIRYDSGKEIMLNGNSIKTAEFLK